MDKKNFHAYVIELQVAWASKCVSLKQLVFIKQPFAYHYNHKWLEKIVWALSEKWEALSGKSIENSHHLPECWIESIDLGQVLPDSKTCEGWTINSFIHTQSWIKQFDAGLLRIISSFWFFFYRIKGVLRSFLTTIEQSSRMRWLSIISVLTIFRSLHWLLLKPSHQQFVVLNIRDQEVDLAEHRSMPCIFLGPDVPQNSLARASSEI